MLRPMLLVGVGGSGGKTLQLLHRELRWRLRDAGWTHGVPAGWQFVHIDVPAEPDTGLPDQAVTVNSALVGGQYVALAHKGVHYRAIDENWLLDAGSEELAKVASWRPKAEDVTIAIDAGAGQYRTIGRVVAQSRADQVQDAIGKARQRISDPAVQPELQRLSRHLGDDANLADATPRAIIVSSMAGGTGAGMFLDVADVIRASDPAGWCDSSIGILFTADVFEEIPELGRQGVMPNSLATICELMNGYWNNRQPGAEYRRLERAGIPVGGFQRRGVRYPLLVGKRNQRVHFGRQVDVYAACAKTLAAFMTSPAAQNSVNAYLAGNWSAAAAGLVDNTPFKDSTKGTVASAMGMGSLSLGRDRFARYSAQRLARTAIEHALRAHTVGRKVPEEVTFEAARDEAVAAQQEWFVHRCGLDEMGEQRNQVLDALRPLDDSAERVATAALQHEVDQMPTGAADAYARIILNGLAHHRATVFIPATDTRMRERAMVWVAWVTEQLEAAVMESVARSGLEVTVELLRRLDDHVGDVINDLNTELPKMERHAGMAETVVREPIAQWGGGAMLCNNELLVRAIQRGVLTLTWSTEERLRRIACLLLEDLQRNQLAPLLEAARDALGQLRVDEHPPAGSPAIGVEDWPTGHIVPDALQPAMNERLVEPTSTYPAAFAEQLVATVRRPDDPHTRLGAVEAERLAAGEVLTGRAHRAEARVIERSSEWWPNLLSTQRPGSVASYRFHLRAGDLLERAEDWVHRTDTAFGDHVQQSLRSYVDVADAAVRAERRAKVLGAFKEVLDVAPPLIEMNNLLVRAVHGHEPASQFHFTAVPFGQHELEAELLAIAEANGQAEDALLNLRSAMGTGDEQRIEIITTLSAPVEPMTLASVMRPIAEQWVQAKGNPARRETFWRWRRARALPEFVPVSPEVLASMVRGWFVGRLVGALRWDRAAVATEAVRIHDPRWDRDAEFPFPYVGPTPEDEQDLLPAVLESLGVAMLDAQNIGALDPLRAYTLLRELGDSAAPTIRNWVRDGRTPNGTDALPRAWKHRGFAGTSDADATPADRQQAVLEYLEGRRRNYVQRLDDAPVTMPTLTTQPSWADLRDQLAAAFSHLEDAAKSVDTSGDGGNGGD